MSILHRSQTDLTIWQRVQERMRAAESDHKETSLKILKFSVALWRVWQIWSCLTALCAHEIPLNPWWKEPQFPKAKHLNKQENKLERSWRGNEALGGLSPLLFNILTGWVLKLCALEHFSLFFELCKYSCDLDAGEVCPSSQHTSRLLYLKSSTPQTAGMPGSTEVDWDKKCTQAAAQPCSSSCSVCLWAPGQPLADAEPSALTKLTPGWPVLTVIQQRLVQKWGPDDHLTIQLADTSWFTPSEALLHTFSVVFTFACNLSKTKWYLETNLCYGLLSSEGLRYPWKWTSFA